MIRPRRDVEIFSMSALDLFASAMGAFVLLAVMMLPYYFKGKEMENQIGELASAVAESQAAAATALGRAKTASDELKKIEDIPGVNVSPEKKAIEEAEERKKGLESKIKEIADKVEEEQKKLAAKKMIKKPKKKQNKVTFRFLGLKTDADRFLILIDGAARIRERAANLPIVLKGIVDVMGVGKEFAIAFYSYRGGKLSYRRWPQTDFVEGDATTVTEALDFIRVEYPRMAGGSATYQALEKGISEDTDSIILVSDGVIFPKQNEKKSWRNIVEEISRANTTGIEINSIAVGIFNRNPNFWKFLNDLRKRNGGDLKAIPP